MKKIFFILLITLNIYGYDAFVDVKTLKSTLDDKNLILVDVSKSYKKSHILGALSFNVDSLTKSEIYSPLKEKEDIESLLRDLGINNSSRIVIYGRNTKQDLQNSAFLAYVLISYGFENVSILDGGYMAWVFDYDILTSPQSPDIEDGDVELTKQDIDVGYGYIRDNKNTLLIDTRYPQRYYGISKKDDDKYIGHIPGAKNSHYAYKFLRDKTLRIQEDLDEMYKDGLDLDNAQNIVVYGENCKDAAVEWYIVYKHMGYKNAKMYYNSFAEYVDWDLDIERFKWE